jgi:hypothetical protein
MFGVLAALLLVASFIIPTSLASPSPVQAAVCKWSSVDMPGSSIARGDIALGPEIYKIAVGNDGMTVLALVYIDDPALPPGPILLNSSFMGLMWGNTAFQNLAAAMAAAGAVPILFDVAIAPDNPAFWAVVTDGSGAGVQPEEMWITQNSGGKWTRTKLYEMTAGRTRTVGALDISVDYGGSRDIAVCMRLGTGTAALDIYVLLVCDLRRCG